MPRRFSKTTELPIATHCVTAEWDGFAARDSEVDGGLVLGIADLVPDEAYKRRGRWKITVEFEELAGEGAN